MKHWRERAGDRVAGNRLKRPWRATWLGRLLRVHSISGHIMNDCWCQRR